MICTQCEANARWNEAGSYHQLAEECREYCRRGHKGAVMIKYNELTKVDSLASRPHKRHRAVVSKIKAPHVNGSVRILDSEVAVTLCGRYVGWFTDASDTSLQFQDGTDYAVECKYCFKE